MDHKIRFEMQKTACEQGVPFNPTSRPYAGVGPHYADAHELHQTDRHVQHALIVGVADHWLATSNVNVVELLACARLVPGQQLGDVTCEFKRGVATSRTWPFYEASYEVTVREARTGRQITVLTVPGDSTPEESCPSVATDDAGTVVARSLTAKALGTALEPLINGTV